MESPAVSLRDLVLDDPGEAVEVEHDGRVFKIWSPSFAQRTDYLTLILGMQDGKDIEEMTSLEKTLAGIDQKRKLFDVLVKCAHDVDGKRIFVDDDVGTLLQATFTPLLAKLIATVEIQLNESLKSLGKGFGETENSSLPAS